MSLLKWKELAESKTKLGNKINYVHDLITQHKIGQETSQDSFAKVFKPVTSKLDDVVASNLISKTPQKRKRPPNKAKVGIDYASEVDPYEDMDVEGLIDYVPPQQNKQIVPKPPTYEESLADVLEGNKEIYVDPQYFPQDPQELPPEYDDDVEVDYAIDDEDMNNAILDDLGIMNYENVDKVLNQPEMTTQKNKIYLKKVIKDAEFKKKQLSGYKSKVTKDYKKGVISEADRDVMYKRLDDSRAVLNEYIKHYKTKTGTGIKGRRRKQRGGNVMFFNDVKQLLNKLELIIGEIIAGKKKNFSTFSYKLVQISPIMILVNSGAFLSISSWFCELTELIFVMIPYISSTGYPQQRKELWVMCK